VQLHALLLSAEHEHSQLHSQHKQISLQAILNPCCLLLSAALGKHVTLKATAMQHSKTSQL
jgi:hypothetical protein